MVNFICFKRILEDEIVNKVNNNESFVVCFFFFSVSLFRVHHIIQHLMRLKIFLSKALLTKHLIIEHPSGIRKDFIIVCLNIPCFIN